jgi:CRISPR type IV-associated protein Csf1
MENLKITFNLSRPIILNRYFTIDSFLLAIWFDKIKKERNITGFINTKDYLDEISNFIKVINNTISGSIWYISHDNPIAYFNNSIFKKTDVDFFRKLNLGKKIETNRGHFKEYFLKYNAIVTKSIYFYIAGDKNVIESLLRGIGNLFIGKKNVIGFGEIKDYSIEIIETDKSFVLNDSTPAKPLSCKYWNIKSHKLMFYREYPPYWEKSDKTLCYMPTTSLVETMDKSYDKGFKSVLNTDFISPSEFAYEYFNKEKISYNYNDDGDCALCGNKKGRRITKEIFEKVYRKDFTDYPFLSGSGFVCDACIWSLTQLAKTAAEGSIVEHNKITYFWGDKTGIEKKERKLYVAKILSNLSDLKPPFLILFRHKRQNQHYIFKGTVSISTALIPIQFGDDTLIVDNEILIDAIKDLNILIHDKKIQKGIILSGRGYDKYSQEFYKKYDATIMQILNFIVY